MSSKTLAEILDLSVMIAPADENAARHVISRIRRPDQEELMAAHGHVDQAVILNAVMAGRSWCVRLHQEPTALFGYVKRSPYVVEGWSFGTEKMARTIPAMTSYILCELTRRWNAEGVHVCEVRSIERHKTAHGWLENIGFGLVGRLIDEGRGGETFHLYAWRRPWGVVHG